MDNLTTTNDLTQRRQQLREVFDVDHDPMAVLFGLERMVAPQVLTSLIEGIRTGVVSPYQSAIAYSTLMKTAMEIRKMDIELSREVQTETVQEPATESVHAKTKRKELESFAEKLLVQMSRPEVAARFQ
jgi:hypothetical protein